MRDATLAHPNKFPLGTTLATPGALAALARAGQDLAPPASAAALQLALDEAQAWASLGDRRRAAAARHQAALTRAMLPGAILAGAGPVPTPASGHDAQASPPAGLDLAGAAAS